MNIKSIDLNLLTALKALLEEKQVTRAAERVGISQPAMSRALGKLRKLLKDSLLVKSKDGYALTVRAKELLQPLQHIFLEINQIIVPPSTKISEMQGEIVIAARDHEIVSLLPFLIKKITKEAPNLTLRVSQLVSDDFSSLERQEADFVICAAETKIETLYRTILYHEEFICLTSSKNLDTARNLTLKKFLEMQHCLVTTTGFGLGNVDSILEKKGLQRKIFLRIPYFLAIAYIIADTNLIVTIPKRLGIIMANKRNIHVFAPPITIPHFPIYLYWHARNQNNIVHQWIRKLITDYCKKI